MKRSLPEYLKRYVEYPIDAKKKRHVYQRIVGHIARHNVTRFRVLHFLGKAVIVVGLTVVFIIGGFFSRWFWGGQGSVLAPGVSVTYAEQIGQIVSAEGYFDIYSQGSKVISHIVRVNDVIFLQEGSEIVMMMGDDLSVIITGPAKVLVRINPATGKYRLSFLEGSNIRVRSQRERSEESLGIEVEMKDGSLLVSEPLPSFGSEIVVRQAQGAAVVVNRSQQTLHVVRPRSSQKESIPQNISRAIVVDEATGQPDFETREIFMKSVGIVDKGQMTGHVVDKGQMTGHVVDKGQMTGHVITGDVTTGHVVNVPDEHTSLSGGNQHFAMSSTSEHDNNNDNNSSKSITSTSEAHDEKKTEPTDGLTPAQRMIVYRWADHPTVVSLVANIVSSDIADKSFVQSSSYQTLLMYTMQTYTAYGVVYPGSTETYSDLVRALDFLRHFLKKKKVVPDDVLVGVSFTYHMLRERSMHEQCDDCYQALLRRIPARFRIN